MHVIGVKHAEHLLVETRAAGLCDADPLASANFLDALTGSVKCHLVVADALDGDRSLLVHTVAYIPFDHAEVHPVFFACVQAHVEHLGVEQVPNEADRESLQV